MELTITNEQKILVTANPITPGGKPAKLDGPIRITKQSGDGDFLIQPDGLSFYLISGDTVPEPGQPVDTVYSIEGDADMSPGTRTIGPETVTLHVIAAEASAFGLTTGQAEMK